MTSSGSSSSSDLALGLLAAVALGLCPVARAAPEEAPSRRLALFPVQNLTGATAPVKELTAALRGQLERRGVALVPEEDVHRTLAERRTRYTGGLDRATAAALRAEVGADGVIIPSLEAWLATAPFRFALTTRLVSTDPDPAILWADSFARTGVDAPGLLGMGVVPGVAQLGDQALDQTAASLATAVRKVRPVPACPERGARSPRRVFRSPLLADPNRKTIAVLPFLNGSGRRDAGEVMTVRFLAALVAADTIQVVEPGVVRAEMLTHRLGATGALSLDDARVILELVDADLVLSGTVRTFEEVTGAGGAPSVEVGAWVLDRNTTQLVWSSTSRAIGDDGVYLFGLGRTSTASALACSLAKGAVSHLLGGRPPLPPHRWPAGSAPPAGAGAGAAPP
jgi:TolB-like protein